MHKTSEIQCFQSFLLLAAEAVCSDYLRPAIALSALQGARRVLESWGITSQGVVRATASARLVNATAVNCMRPFSVADKWIESYSPTDQYNHYDSTGNVLAGTPDQYLPPTSGSAGSGYRATGSPNEIGAQASFLRIVQLVR